MRGNLDLTNLDQEISRDFYYLILTMILLTHPCLVHAKDCTKFSKASLLAFILACDSSNFRAKV